jgi:predicted ArsR family transcriptional regulator
MSQDDDLPPGAEQWIEQTKGIERVIDIVLTVEQPQTAGWIAEEAHVSEQSAREHLDLIADLGIVTATKARGVTKYQPDAGYLRYKQVSSLIERYDRETLLEQVEELKQTDSDTRERYEVEEPDELRALAAADDTSIEDVREYKRAASEWETVLHDLDLHREALERYDEFDRDATTVTA